MRLLSVRYACGCSKSFHFLFISTTKNLRVYFYLSIESSVFHLPSLSSLLLFIALLHLHFHLDPLLRYLTGQMSSIFKIILAHSVAKLNADVVTNSGCKTFSFLMSLTVPFFTLMPSWTLPNMACLFLNSVTISIGFNPAFSAKVYGITSNASAKAFTQTDSCLLYTSPSPRD